MDGTDSVMENLLERLNVDQRAAAEHDLSPLLIVAGAGTGKTTTLVHRVAVQLHRGIHPSRIMLLTFTRRSAQQMIDRMRLLHHGNDEVSGIWAGTFHAISVRLLRVFGESIGIPRRFTVHDRSDAEDFLDDLIQRYKKQTHNTSLPKKGTALNIHSFQVNSQWPLKQVLLDNYEEYQGEEKNLQKIFQQYQTHKKQMGVLDYDDLLLAMRDLCLHPEVGPRIASRFDSVLVDEYQDTNPLQSQILMALRPDGKGITAVGDEAQSIYSFRAATVRNILDFPKQFPNATLLKLEQNYRSTQAILNVSNSLMNHSSESFGKSLWSQKTESYHPQLVQCAHESAQAEFIVKRIQAHAEQGIRVENQAVLFRASHHSLALETELARSKIPYVKYGGLKFAESAHVKDLLAYLRLAENIKDTVAALRVLLLMPGIGPKKASQCVDLLEISSSGLEIWNQAKPPAGSQKMWKSFVALLTNLARHEPTKLSQQLKATFDFYLPLMKEKYDNAPQRERDLEQLLAMADRFDSREQLLVDLAIDPPNNTEELPSLDPSEPKPKPLVLSTIHSAKGLEWDVVYVMNACSGAMPFPRAATTREGYEEERRLFYVALTRAAEWLYVTYPIATMGQWSSWSTPMGGRTEFITTDEIKMFQQQKAAMFIEPKTKVSITIHAEEPSLKGKKKPRKASQPNTMDGF